MTPSLHTSVFSSLAGGMALSAERARPESHDNALADLVADCSANGLAALTLKQEVVRLGY